MDKYDNLKHYLCVKNSFKSYKVVKNVATGLLYYSNDNFAITLRSNELIIFELENGENSSKWSPVTMQQGSYIWNSVHHSVLNLSNIIYMDTKTNFCKNEISQNRFKKKKKKSQNKKSLTI